MQTIADIMTRELVSMLTDRDITIRALAEDLELDAPVEAFMSEASSPAPPMA